MLGKKKKLKGEKKKKKAAEGGGKRCSQPAWLRSATSLGFVCILLCSGFPGKLRAQTCTGIRGSAAVGAIPNFPGSARTWVLQSPGSARTWVLQSPINSMSSFPFPIPAPQIPTQPLLEHSCISGRCRLVSARSGGNLAVGHPAWSC